VPTIGWRSDVEALTVDACSRLLPHVLRAELTW
jgi:hypothetical protein